MNKTPQQIYEEILAVSEIRFLMALVGFLCGTFFIVIKTLE